MFGGDAVDVRRGDDSDQFASGKHEDVPVALSRGSSAESGSSGCAVGMRGQRYRDLAQGRCRALGLGHGTQSVEAGQAFDRSCLIHDGQLGVPRWGSRFASASDF